jgi:hypothetical protein
VIACSLCLGASSAAAAEPIEAPEAQAPFEVSAHAAYLYGFLNPGKSGGPYELDTYDFVYRATSSGECEGSGQIETLESNSLGFGREEVSQHVEGLGSGTEYAVCLVAHNGSESSVSAPISFKTAIAPEVPSELQAEVLSASEATLKGTLNPGAPGESGSYEFIYREGGEGCQGFGEQRIFGEAGGEQEEHVETTLSGLLANVTYSFCLLAKNQLGETAISAPVTFTTESLKPEIVPGSAEAVELSPTSSELTAKVNPQGSATHYRIEYGTSTAYGSVLPIPPAPEPSIGAGHQPISIAQTIASLQSNVTYHWRLILESSVGTTVGADHTFVNSTLGETLPDNRAYEMVTPVQKNTAALGRFRATTPISVSADGTRLMAGALQCFAASESCTGKGEGGLGDPFLFSRTASGWLTSALAPPAALFPTNSQITSDAETGDALFFVPTAGKETSSMYLRTATGEFQDVGPLTELPVSRNGTEIHGRQFEATADFSHIVFSLEDSPLWPSLFPTPVSGKTLFEYSGTDNAAPRLVAVSGGAGSSSLISACMSALGSGAPFGSGEPTGTEHEPNAMSADGNTVFFAVEHCAEGTGENAGRPVPANELFARIDANHTVPISEPSAFSPAAPYPGCTETACVQDVNESANWRPVLFTAASTDGSKAFFRSEQRLLNDAVQDQNNLYEYDFDRPQAPLTDLSAGDTSGSGPGVDGVVATSADGSHVYFVAGGVLDEQANANGEKAQEGAYNLYVYSEEGGAGNVSFIARLAESDAPQWGGQGQEEDTFANVTPDGRYLVFESSAPITPDTGEGAHKQVFRYDAATGQLLRISTGLHGFNDNGNAGVGDATIVPSVEQFGYRPAGPPRPDPTMSDDGSYVFFQSPNALTQHALNDVKIGTEDRGEHAPLYAENVYEWHEGEVHLISDGRDSGLGPEASDVELLESDASGANVFFTTSSQLVPQDTDTQVDIYDARICSQASPCIPPPPATTPPCDGEDCRGTPAASTPSATPASEKFSGIGNATPPAPATPAATPAAKPSKLAAALAACRKIYPHSKKRRAKCEASAHRRYGPHAKKPKPKRRKASK